MDDAAAGQPDPGNLGHVLSRRQLFEVGATRHHLRNRINSGLWQGIGPYVVVMHNGPLSPAQQLWAAVQHAGPAPSSAC